MVDLSQKLGAILGSLAFVTTLFATLLANQSLLLSFRYAAFGFLAFIVIGWILGALWEYANRGKQS